MEASKEGFKEGRKKRGRGRRWMEENNGRKGRPGIGIVVVVH
jgi:hypothetical protein